MAVSASVSMNAIIDLLDRPLLGNPTSRWLLAAAVVTVAVAAVRPLRRTAARLLLRLAARSDTDFDDMLVEGAVG